MAYDTLPSEESIERTVAGLTERGFGVFVVDTRADALKKIRALIPSGAEIMTGSSRTLEEVGFMDLLKSGDHPWKNLKDAILAEKDAAMQAELRKRSVLADYFLGSVHAITEAGQTITASQSGSQLPSYAFTSKNVIWVAGAQKIVLDLNEAFKRIGEYVLPLEDKRMKSLGYPGSSISKLLIYEKEPNPMRKVQMILVREILGF